jgi:CubicO group peptidase (beta-lactamase class C family)
METHAPRLSRSLAVIEQGIKEGHHLGAQLYVSRDSEVLANQAVGEARIGVPMRQESVVLWLSSGKPVTAVALARLWESGRLALDDQVSKHIPEFGQGGKEAVTIRHLLTHTGGIRTAEKCDLGKDWPEIIACVCTTPLEPHWIPGQQAAYHPSSSWYVLGEIAQRLDGRPFHQYVREVIFEPCGMRDAWLALPPPDFQRYGDRLALMYHTEKGAPSPHRRWNTEADAAVCRPGRNARGPIRQLGRFYEHLLQLRGGRVNSADSILKPETARQLTTRQRVGLFDDTFQQVIDWGLGFAIDSKRYGREMVPYGYGRFASEQTFGHGGSQSSCAFADPAHQLVVAWAFNGCPGERRHQHRAHELNSAIYDDLGLADRPGLG